MSDKPIIFNTEMVRAILDGKKTQTRRLDGLKIINKNPDNWKFTGTINDTLGYSASKGFMWFEFKHKNSESPIYIKSKYQPGDRLWVRETWKDATYSNDGSRPQEKFVFYKADIDGDEDKYFCEWSNTFGKFPPRKWKPSIFMPKKYARIWLEVLNVRVERLQEIDAFGCLDEGTVGSREALTHPQSYIFMGAMKTIFHNFETLWDSINKKRGYGWDVNPWVFVYEFRRHYESMGGIE